jgi:hypothetical protein
VTRALTSTSRWCAALGMLDSSQPEALDDMNTCTLSQARAAKQQALKTLATLAPVTGIGITRIDQGYGLKVNLERAPAAPLPSDVDGVPVRVEVVGKISKHRAAG